MVSFLHIVLERRISQLFSYKKTSVAYKKSRWYSLFHEYSKQIFLTTSQLYHYIPRLCLSIQKPGLSSFLVYCWTGALARTSNSQACIWCLSTMRMVNFQLEKAVVHIGVRETNFEGHLILIKLREKELTYHLHRPSL